METRILWSKPAPSPSPGLSSHQAQQVTGLSDNKQQISISKIEAWEACSPAHWAMVTPTILPGVPTLLPSDPIIMLTKPLEELNKLAEKAGIPLTLVQILEKALLIIRATRDFELALNNWEERPQNQKTWANLKTHFHEA